jgi:hypothetical protein
VRRSHGSAQRSPWPPRLMERKDETFSRQSLMSPVGLLFESGSIPMSTTMALRFIVLQHDRHGLARNQQADVHWSVARRCRCSRGEHKLLRSLGICGNRQEGAAPRVGAIPQRVGKMRSWRLTLSMFCVVRPRSDRVK